MIRFLLSLFWRLVLLALALALVGAGVLAVGYPLPLPPAWRLSATRLGLELAGLFRDRAAWRSLAVGASAAAIASAIGTLAALELWRAVPRRMAGIAEILLPAALIAIMGAAALPFLILPKVAPAVPAAIIAAHTALAVPVVVVMVLASLQRVDPALPLIAAASGASSFAAFRQLLWPLIRPGVLAGAAFAFATFLDENAVSGLLFHRRAVFPSAALAAAIAPLMIAVAAVLAAAQWLRRVG